MKHYSKKSRELSSYLALIMHLGYANHKTHLSLKNNCWFNNNDNVNTKNKKTNENEKREKSMRQG